MGDVAREEVGNQNEGAKNSTKKNKVITPKFHPKMEEPQKASLEKNWKEFKEFFQKDPQALLEIFDLTLNTAIHVATRSNNPKLLTDLLDMLPDPADRWRALRIGNAHKQTVLHHIIHCKEVKMVKAVVDYDKKLELPEDPPEDKRIAPEAKELPLLELRNDLGETPVFRAAKYGKLEILKYMYQYVDDMENHFDRTDHTSILHIAIIGQYFEVATWLTKVPGIDKLVHQMDGNGLTCLQLLSRMPSVFRSHSSNMESFEKLIYHLLPEQECEASDNGKGRNQGTDLESGKDNAKPTSSGTFFSRINHAIWKFIAKVLPEQECEASDNGKGPNQGTGLESGQDNAKPTSSVFSRINHAFWKFIAKEYDGINLIWKTKKKHKLAEQLADFLVQKDNSWHDSHHTERRQELVLPVIQPSNIKKKSIPHKLQSNEKEEQPIRSSVYTPLLLAASTGIVEIVQKIIEENPEAIAHVSPNDSQNVLHVAVKHRQKKIYKVLKEYGALDRLASQMGNKNRTLLHQVARMDYFNGENKAGVVFQLQDELQWFERVKKVLPPRYIFFCNDNELTARELFEIEHAEMLREAQDWIKGTAQSCSAVAVLIATVVFAAAYTIPGGTNDNGVPIFLNSPLFLFFTITDIVALASSLVSVMMFLSILTSPFEMKNFHKSLPRKLTLGFTLLFFSLTTTMLAFGSTILLTIRMEKDKWSSSLIYSVTFFPVTLFGLMQFPIYMVVKYRVKRLWKSLKKVLPSRFTKSNTGIKKRCYAKHS